MVPRSVEVRIEGLQNPQRCQLREALYRLYGFGIVEEVFRFKVSCEGPQRHKLKEALGRLHAS